MKDEEDTPGRILKKLNVMSWEFIGIVFLVGVSWTTLTMNQGALADKVEEHKEERVAQLSEIKADTEKLATDVEELSDDVNDVNRKLDVMGNIQQHNKEQLDSLKGLDTRLNRMLMRLEENDSPQNE